jgi:glycosyltransferase involved in cell wall biosynthesis
MKQVTLQRITLQVDKSFKYNAIISAYNIHSGGGKTLLDEFIETIDSSKRICCLIDTRYTPPVNYTHINFIKVKPTLINRIQAEWNLKELSSLAPKTICFGNLPPLFNLSSTVLIFLQNRFIITKNSIDTKSLTSILRSFIERAWFRSKIKPSYEILLQTESMHRLFVENFGDAFKVQVAGFNNRNNKINKDQITGKGLIYVASGEEHKNHKTLINSLAYLSKRNFHPELTLVLDQKTNLKLYSWINEQITKFSLKVKLIDTVTLDKLHQIYREHEALIFPSTFESYGLPLVEAKKNNLKIIASELDYIRDVCEPDETFDPNSYISIARAISRFYNRKSSIPENIDPNSLV